MRTARRAAVVSSGLAIALWNWASASDSAPNDGKKVFSCVVKAMGGADRVKALRAIRYQVDVVVGGGETAQRQAAEIIIGYPDKLVFAAKLPNGLARRIINGDKGVMRMPDSVRALPEDAVKASQAIIHNDFFFIAQNLDRYEIRALGPTRVKEAERLALEITGPSGPFTLFVDAHTCLPARAHYHMVEGGKTTEIDEEFSDFRTVNGLTMYFKTERYSGDRLLNAFIVHSLEINPSLDPGMFATE